MASVAGAMTDHSFQIALNFVLDYEGGYVDHPDDPGGATNFGVTLKTLQEFRGHNVSKEDVKNLSSNEVEQIYYKKYWLDTNCEHYPAWLSLMVFDCAVNQGPHKAKIFLQRALRVPADGLIGPVTLKAIRNISQERSIIVDFCTFRGIHYATLGHFNTFGKGWFRRLFNNALASYNVFLLGDR